MNALFALLKENVMKYPAKTAILFNGNHITYKQLYEETQIAKEFLLQTGIEKEKSVVFFSATNSIAFYIMLFAFYDLNITLYLVDPKTTATEWENLLDTFGCDFIIREKSNLDVNKIDYLDFVIEKSEQRSSAEFQSIQTCFFTSGTTGMPKVFGFTDSQLIQKLSLLSKFMGFNENDKVLCPLSATHDHGFILTVSFLLVGATVCLLKSSPSFYKDIATTIQENEITVFTGVPLVYASLLEAVNRSDAFKSLRYAFCGSAPLSEKTAEQFYSKFNIQLNHAYGISEIGPICINMNITSEPNFKSIGKVLPYIEYKIINEDGEPVEDGEQGELIVRSLFMTNGYIKNEEDTAKLLIDGWMHTQDLVYEDEQKYVYIIGRKTTFINNAGYKVYPVEVEKVLLSMEGIKQALVAGMGDENRSQKIIAYITTFIPLSSEEIHLYCRGKLSKYKCPHEIIICDELPVNSIGKIIASKVKS